MATTISANTSGTVSAAQYQMDLMNSADSSIELSKQFAQLKCSKAAPKRQPTIVCEDIASDDDELFDDEDFDDKETDETGIINEDKLLFRSPSTASLTVPKVVCEDQKTEKRRPPLPDQ